MSTTFDRRSLVQDGRWITWAAASTIVTGFFVATRPLTHWELDEILFRMGVERFEPLLHQPHPPGYPLLIGLGKASTLLTGDPFHGLVLLSIVSMAVSFAAFGAAVTRVTGHDGMGLAASTLFHLSPAMMVHGSTPMSDPAALMFASLALCCAATREACLRPPSRQASRDTSVSFARLRRAAVVTEEHLTHNSSFQPVKTAGNGLLPSIGVGAFAAASIGCRPQYALAILPFLAVVLARDRRLERAAALLASFTLVCLAWLVPLVASTGGLTEMIAWQRAQADWVARNDAGLARGTQPLSAVAFRFIAHPWGSKLTSAPMLMLAAAGALVALRARMTALLPLATLSAVHLLTAIAINDPADGVRYGLPGHYLVAALAAIALTTLASIAGRQVLAPVAVGAAVAAFWIYVEPVVSLRRSEPSPPAQAAAWARGALDPDTIVLYDQSLRPHALTLFRGFQTAERLEDADVAAGRPVYRFGEGVDPLSEPIVFEWPFSDAYGKLTRNHYRVVSLSRVEAPVVPLEGVGPWESAGGGPRWQWLSDDARFNVPAGPPAGIIVLGLPADAPYEETDVTAQAGDRLLHDGTIRRGGTLTLPVTLPADAFVLRIRSSRHYDLPGGSRRFGVQLFHFDRHRQDTATTDRRQVPASQPRDVASLHEVLTP